MVVEPDGRQLTELALLAQKGELRTRVAQRLPMTAAPEAHRRLVQGGLRGKLVLIP
ncbi:zinc-binding dehydrogenase [Streptacidiphilus monticola]|uniref:Zinc-binding dehydrogenase n=1 Tax=Streptacidiphilus monticola TaxID=2161674 RepID=A0ABW1FUI4_9ACTN